MSNIIGDIEEIGSVAGSLISTLASVIHNADPQVLQELYGVISNPNSTSPSFLVNKIGEGIKVFDTDLGRLILEPLLAGTMGVDYGKLKSDSAEAIGTLEGAIGFSLVLDGIVSSLDLVIKTLMGDRAPEFILDSIRKIPESIGLNYFMGLTLSNTFERAVGTPLEEAINIQVLPSRLDIQTIKMALRQHKMTTAEADTYRAKLGYPESDWQTLLELNNSVLPIADLQLAYEYGLMSDAEITSYLQQQGFSETDITLLMQVYLLHSETSGGQVYRSVARTAYLESAISSDQFSKILGQANVPENSIKLELAALDLQKSIGLKQLSAGDLKVALNNGDLTLAEVTIRLKDLGYSEDDVTLIIKEWTGGSLLTKPTVTAKQVLRYYNSGVIDSTYATQLLDKIGIRSQDIASMLSNSSIIGSGYVHELSDATIISAYKDGVIDVDRAKALLIEVGVEPTNATLLLEVAMYQMTHKTKKATGAKTIDLAQIQESMKYGLVTDAWAIREIEALGYSTSDAELIVAIETTKLSGNTPTNWQVLN